MEPSWGLINSINSNKNITVDDAQASRIKELKNKYNVKDPQTLYDSISLSGSEYTKMTNLLSEGDIDVAYVSDLAKLDDVSYQRAIKLIKDNGKIIGASDLNSLLTLDDEGCRIPANPVCSKKSSVRYIMTSRLCKHLVFVPSACFFSVYSFSQTRFARSTCGTFRNSQDDAGQVQKRGKEEAEGY